MTAFLLKITKINSEHRSFVKIAILENQLYGVHVHVLYLDMSEG